LSNFILNKIKEINHSGVAVMLIEQNVKAAIGIADYLYVLLSGKKVLEGPSEKFIKDFKILEDAFFGKVREV
ncbi:MAG: ABC transporter ATP-binding protein, partial [Nitrososphaerota archaeon]